MVSSFISGLECWIHSHKISFGDAETSIVHEWNVNRFLILSTARCVILTFRGLNDLE